MIETPREGEGNDELATMGVLYMLIEGVDEEHYQGGFNATNCSMTEGVGVECASLSRVPNATTLEIEEGV